MIPTTYFTTACTKSLVKRSIDKNSLD